MPKQLLWFIGLVVVGILLITFYAGTYPGRVALVNQSGRGLEDVRVGSGNARVEVGSLRSGETRIVSLPSGATVEVTFQGRREPRRWRSIEPLGPGQSMMLYITPEERVALRRGRDKTR